MGTSEYLHLSHSVSNLVYHFVCPTKYRHVVLDGMVNVEESLKQICAGIELGYDYIRALASTMISHTTIFDGGLIRLR